MSIESARTFIEKTKTDQTFADHVSACENETQVLELAKQSGIAFTPEELKQAASELSDADLDMVTGGAINYFVRNTGFA